MKRGDLAQIRMQYYWGRLFIFIAAPLLALLIRMLGYRIRNLTAIRERIDAYYKAHPGPWMICANHLTMVDSFIICYAMFPFYQYMVEYRRVPWNVPEKLNFNRNIFLTAVCYLLKCIPIIRGGEREIIHSFFLKCSYLFDKRETLMIFPEGSRSRTGRIEPESVSYGPGRLLSGRTDCRVLCVYLRGDHQSGYGVYPQKNEGFYMAVDLLMPAVAQKGLRVQREISRKIIGKLEEMERAYFETRRKRYH